MFLPVDQLGDRLFVCFRIKLMESGKKIEYGKSTMFHVDGSTDLSSRKR